MKLATGIASLFVAAASGVHSAIFFLGRATGDDHTLTVAYICAVMAALFLFGGSLAFKEIRKAKVLFIVALGVGLASTILVSHSTLIWTVAAVILTFLSDNAEKPAKVTA